jgi:hypothetical protein
VRSVFLLLVCAAAALGQPAPPAYPSIEAFTAWTQGNYLAPFIEFREKREVLTALEPGEAERAMRSGYLQQ